MSVGPVKISHQHFPDPAEALALGWTAKQIMDGCKRMPKDDLTDELRQRLLDCGLSPWQVKELYKHCRAALEAHKAHKRRENEDEEPGRSFEDMADTQEKTTFLDGLAAGLTPRMALEQCAPASIKEFTKEIAERLASAGFSGEEMAHAFGTPNGSMRVKLSKLGVKLGHKSRPKPQEEELAAGGIVTGAGLPLVGEPGDILTSAAKISAETLREAACESADKIIVNVINSDTGAPADEEEWQRFGLSQETEGPMLVIHKDGKLWIRRVDMDTELRYVVDFNKSFSRCRVVDHPRGKKLTKTEKNSFCCTVRLLLKQLTELGISLPLRYRLDPETMEGERVEV